MCMLKVQKEKLQSGIHEIIPIHRGTRGSKPTILTSCVDESKERWRYRKCPSKLTAQEKKRVLGCVVQQMIKVIFSTHVYEFDGTLYLQTKGGPMGLRSSGPLSRLFMDQWAKDMDALEQKTKELFTLNPVEYEPLKTHLRKKYVDDVATAIDEFREGTRWNPEVGAFTWSMEAQAEDRGADMQARTMKEYSKAASQAVKCLNFTWDCPTQHEVKKMPVLDTQLWVDEPAGTEYVPKMCEMEADTKPRTYKQVRLVQFQFYKKPMANRVPNRASNALPERQKVTGATQEVIRRMKNTSTKIDQGQTIKEILKEYMGELRAGGYSSNWRREVLTAGLTGYARMWSKEVNESKMGTDQSTKRC